MLKIEQFVQENKGKFVGSHECVALCQAYQEYVGWPVIHANAIDWQYHTGKDYKFIKNYPWTIPHPSDFAVFDVGPYGHVGIVVRAGLLKMDVFNQNWPKGNDTNPCIVTSFNYRRPKCLGFLRKT